eukprot:gene41570-56252_t
MIDRADATILIETPAFRRLLFAVIRAGGVFDRAANHADGRHLFCAGRRSLALELLRAFEAVQPAQVPGGVPVLTLIQTLGEAAQSVSTGTPHGTSTAIRARRDQRGFSVAIAQASGCGRTAAGTPPRASAPGGCRRRARGRDRRREALVGGNWETRLPFLAANQKMIAKVEELEHKSRRQDVLVDDELIYAFYDQQLPPEVCSGHSFEAWYRDESRKNPDLQKLTREELMRHEAAGITSAAFPKTLRLGGVDCACEYLHVPGDPRDGLSVTLPIFALNQASDDRCD